LEQYFSENNFFFKWQASKLFQAYGLWRIPIVPSVNLMFLKLIPWASELLLLQN